MSQQIQAVPIDCRIDVTELNLFYAGEVEIATYIGQDLYRKVFISATLSGQVTFRVLIQKHESVTTTSLLEAAHLFNFGTLPPKE